MNRTIKFRAQRSDDNRWVYGHYFQAPLTIENFGCGYLTTPDLKKLDCIEQDGVVFSIKKETLGQFTGLKDKNGKEIYENDIVKTNPEHSSIMNVEWCEYTHGIVSWLREGFNICQKYIGSNEIHQYASCHCHPCGLEVIGNIYEDKEMLDKMDQILDLKMGWYDTQVKDLLK